MEPVVLILATSGIMLTVIGIKQSILQEASAGILTAANITGMPTKRTIAFML